MTIYVCQELEQNRASLQQKRDGSSDSSLCGELQSPDLKTFRPFSLGFQGLA